jgi:hypothetical protein
MLGIAWLAHSERLSRLTTRRSGADLNHAALRVGLLLREVSLPTMR